MKKSPDLTQQEFDDLLSWLAPDRSAAGEEYVRIRDGLIRFFRIKGCHEPESLADETIIRLARKLKSLDTSKNYKYLTYFYGFAKNIFLEYLADVRKSPIQLESELTLLQEDPADENNDLRFACLDKCMAALKSDEAVLITAYFSYDEGEKLEARQKLAKKLNITTGNLHIRVFRIKNKLRKCIDNCISRG